MKLTLNGEFEYHPSRCPVTGILATMGCRCQSCRPDLHWFTNTAAATTTTHYWVATGPIATGPGWVGAAYPMQVIGG